MPGSPRFRLELSVIKLALTDEKKFSEISPDLFTSQSVKDLYLEIAKIKYEKGQLPSLTLLEELLRREDKWEKYSTLFDALNNIQVKEEEWKDLLEGLVQLKHISIIEDALVSAAEDIEKKKFSSAINTLKSALNEYETFKSNLNLSVLEIGNANEEVLKNLKEEEMFGGDDFISTGYELLDERIQGGFKRGDLIVISAIKGTGKSVLAMNLAHNAFKFGCNVVYGNFEMSRDVWFKRYLSLVSNVPFRLIFSGNLNLSQKYEVKSKFILNHFKDDFVEELARRMEAKKDLVLKTDVFVLLRKLMKKYKEHVRENKILLYQKSNIPYWELDADIQKIKETNGLDMLIIDYINFIKHENPKLPSWDQLKTISDRLKQMAIKYNIVVIVLSQLNAKEQDTKYSAGITEASDITFAWTLSSSYYLPDAKIFDFKTLKTRNIQPIDDLYLIGEFDRMSVRFELNEQASILGDNDES